MSDEPLFDTVCLIGIGLIGSSLARVIRRDRSGTAYHRLRAHRRNAGQGERAGPGGRDVEGSRQGGRECRPRGDLDTHRHQWRHRRDHFGPHLKQGAIVTDVGSVKQAVMAAIGPHIPEGVHFVPGHPLAGTENSGPEAGFRRTVRRPLVRPDARRDRPTPTPSTRSPPYGTARDPGSTCWMPNITTPCWRSPPICRR